MRIARAEQSRRHFLGRLLAATTAVLLAGCDAASRSTWFPKVLGIGERASRSVTEPPRVVSILLLPKASRTSMSA